MMEILQILKALYRNERLTFADAWVSETQDEVEHQRTVLDIPLDTLQHMLASQDLVRLEETIANSFDWLSLQSRYLGRGPQTTRLANNDRRGKPLGEYARTSEDLLPFWQVVSRASREICS
jgi:hypothetical protein